MAEIENKMRIQLYDTDFNMLSDRLVAQGPEFAKGPQEPHHGPLKVEFSLFTREETEACIKYLGQLIENVPVGVPKGKRGRKRLSTSSPSYQDNLLKTIKDTMQKPNFIKSLREEGFGFTTLDFLQDMGYPIAVPLRMSKRYKWLVKMIREAKNPLNNKYDISILIGIREGALVVYSGDEVLLKGGIETDLTPDIKVPIKFRVKFPTYMQHDERAKFRVEVELLKKDSERVPTKLYKRWLGEVMRESPLEINFPKADIIPDLYEKGKTVKEVQSDLTLDKDF